MPSKKVAVDVKYFDHAIGGETIRQFTLDEHGASFADLAQEFATTNHGTIITETTGTSDESEAVTEPVPRRGRAKKSS